MAGVTLYYTYSREFNIHYLDVDVTAWGPYRTKFAATRAVKMALENCIAYGDFPPIVRTGPGVSRTRFHVQLRGPRLSLQQVCRAIVDRLSTIRDDAQYAGVWVMLEFWSGCKMSFNRHLPDE